MLNDIKLMFSKKPDVSDTYYSIGHKKHLIFDNLVLLRTLVFIFGLVFAVTLVYLANIAWPVALGLVFVIPAAILFSSYPFVGIILWILVAPIFVNPGGLNHLYVFWLLHRAMIPFTLVMILLPYLFRMKKEWPIRLGFAEIIMAIFLGLAIISVFTLSINSRSALYNVYDRFFISFCLYLIVRFSGISEKDIKILVWVVVIQVIIQSVVGLAANFAPELLPARWYGPVAQVRTVGTFNHPARYTNFLVLCLVIIFQAAMNWKHGKTKMFFTMVFLLGAFMVFMSFSKGSWLGGVLALLGIAFIYPGPTLRIAGVLTVFTMIFGLGLLSNQLSYASERLSNNSTNQRMVANIAMLNMVAASPLVGWGYNNLDLLIDDFVVRLDDYVASENASHSTSLSMMAELGLIAFFAYLLPFIWWFSLTIKAWPRMPKDGLMGRNLVILLWFSILNHFVVGSFSDFRTNTSGVYSIATWWLTLGLIAHLLYPYIKPQDPELNLMNRNNSLLKK